MKSDAPRQSQPKLLALNIRDAYQPKATEADMQSVIDRSPSLLINTPSVISRIIKYRHMAENSDLFKTVGAQGQIISPTHRYLQGDDAGVIIVALIGNGERVYGGIGRFKKSNGFELEYRRRFEPADRIVHHTCAHFCLIFVWAPNDARIFVAGGRCSRAGRWDCRPNQRRRRMQLVRRCTTSCRLPHYCGPLLLPAR
jgi:hypothetical protein